MISLFSLYVRDTSLAFAEKQGRERCVIHSVGDEMSQRVYSTLANDLKSKREYEVQIYGFGRWIEIYKKSGKKR